MRAAGAGGISVGKPVAWMLRTRPETSDRHGQIHADPTEVPPVAGADHNHSLIFET